MVRASSPVSPRPSRRRPPSRVLLGLIGALALVAACSDDSDAGAPAEAGGPAGALSAEEACEANTAAGTITYVSGFDYAASPAILDIVVAEARGYFDELCLDVEIVPGFAPSNGPIVAAGRAQFGSGDSFGEVVKTNVEGEADLVVIAHYGKTAVQALLVPADGRIETLDDLPGTTVGIKGDLPYSLQSMLALAGVERGSFEEILLDGFDPVAHLALGIDALPVYKSNEPVTLEREGIDFRLFDPLDYDVPASFGILFTSRSFLDQHPQAVTDFLRASYRAYADAVANPDEAVGFALDRINAAGNPNFLGLQTEAPRWGIESELVTASTPEGTGPGQLDMDRLGAEIDLLTQVGVFTDEPDWRSMAAPEIGAGLYDGTTVIWPE